jgi:hypothetical protein
MGFEDYMPVGLATNAASVQAGGGKGGMKEMKKAVQAATLAVKAAKSAVKAARHTKRVCPRYCRRKTLRCKRYVRLNRRKSRRSRK